MPERMFKIICNSPYASHETATSSHIVKYWYRITCPSIWKHNVSINVHLQSMKRRGTFDWIQCQDGVVLAVLSIDHTYAMPFGLFTTHTAQPTYKLSLAMRLHRQWLIEDDLNKHSAKHKKSTLLVRGAGTQLGSSYVLAPLATNVDLWNPITAND